MHKLLRDPVAPTGLNRYSHGVDSWTLQSPTYEERQEIWNKLNVMQQERCAYCEAPIEQDKRHIEHFRQRSRYPQGTFEWENLFGSCMRATTCGHHKDECAAYEHSDLIKPDVDDPERFFVFARDGSVSPRANLSPVDARRAAETIRVLNLNGVLRQIRYSEISGYVQTAEEFAAMSVEFPESDWLPLLQDEIKKTAHLPFATAIRHLLTRQS